jgi:hypothetical protein
LILETRRDHQVGQEKGAWIELNTDTGNDPFVNWPPDRRVIGRGRPNMAPRPPPDNPGHLYGVASIHIHPPISTCNRKDL